MRGLGGTVEQEVARIANGQHGVVTRKQLLEAGVTSSGIERRLEKGLIHREYKGVYRVGHRAPSLEAGYLAAVCACGDGALLSGRAAGYLFGLLKGSPPSPEVTAPTKRRIEGIRTQRRRRLDPRDRTSLRQIPITTVPRTLVDLATDLSFDDLARVCHEADVRYHTTPAHVEAALARQRTARGAAKLRRILRGDAHVTLSKLERAFLDLLDEEDLPLPQTNRLAGGRRVDCRWPEHRLTVELNGYRYHRSRHAWEQDRLRKREARAREDEFLEYTYADVFEDPRYMLGELRQLLGTRPSLASRSVSH